MHEAERGLGGEAPHLAFEFVGEPGIIRVQECGSSPDAIAFPHLRSYGDPLIPLADHRMRLP